MIIRIVIQLKTKEQTSELVNIGIATEKEDMAAESDTSCNAQVYDTDLGYTGAVTFGSNWCYFSQIVKVVKEKADDLE